MQIIVNADVAGILGTMSIPIDFLTYCTMNTKPDVKKYLKSLGPMDRLAGELILSFHDKQEKKRRSGYRAYFSKEIQNYLDNESESDEPMVPPVVGVKKGRPKNPPIILKKKPKGLVDYDPDNRTEQKMYTDETASVKETKSIKKESKPVEKIEKTSKKIFTLTEDEVSYSMGGANSYPGSLKAFYQEKITTDKTYDSITTIVKNQPIYEGDKLEMESILNITKDNYDSLLGVMLERGVPRPDNSIYMIENHMTPPNYVLEKENITEVTTTFQYLKKNRPHWTKQIFLDVNTVDWERKDFWYALTQVQEAQLEEIKAKIINIDDPYMQLVCSFITDIVEYDIMMEQKETGIVNPPARTNLE